MYFNALLHFRTESSHFAAMSGILCIIELYCSYVNCSFRRFLERGFFSFLSVVRGQKWVLLSSFLLQFSFVADDEDAEANTVLPIFLPAIVSLLTDSVSAVRSFTIWGMNVARIEVFVEVSLLLFPVSVRIVAEADVRSTPVTFVLCSSSPFLFPV